MMTMPIEENLQHLSSGQRLRFADAYEPTSYGWREFRSDVVAAIRERYFISEGRRCLSVHHWDSLVRVPADVLPAIEYRNYHRFVRLGLEEYDEGVYFRHRNGTAITNFPKLHCANGIRKARATADRSKAAVRCVKNARNHLKECPDLSDQQQKTVGSAASYYLECLVHNVPDRVFDGNMPDVLRETAGWLVCCSGTPEWPKLLCQNEIIHLFGRGPDQWTTTTAAEVVKHLHGMFDRTTD
jgi:hypothetical protein